MVLIIVIHVLVCIILITFILLQPGKSGGFSEGFAAAESMFGAKATSFMVKSTAIIAVIFLVTCLSLAILSSNKEKSLMAKKLALPPVRSQTTPIIDLTQPATKEEAVKTITAPAAQPPAAQDQSTQQPQAPVPAEAK